MKKTNIIAFANEAINRDHAEFNDRLWEIIDRIFNMTKEDQTFLDQHGIRWIHNESIVIADHLEGPNGMKLLVYKTYSGDVEVRNISTAQSSPSYRRAVDPNDPSRKKIDLYTFFMSPDVPARRVANVEIDVIAPSNLIGKKREHPDDTPYPENDSIVKKQRRLHNFALKMGDPSYKYRDLSTVQQQRAANHSMVSKRTGYDIKVDPDTGKRQLIKVPRESAVVRFANEAINRDHAEINARLLSIMKTTSHKKADDDFLASLRIRTAGRRNGRRALYTDNGREIYYVDSQRTGYEYIEGLAGIARNRVLDLDKVDLYSILRQPSIPARDRKDDLIRQANWHINDYRQEKKWQKVIPYTGTDFTMLPQPDGTVSRRAHAHADSKKILDALVELRDQLEQIIDHGVGDPSTEYMLPFPDATGTVTNRPVKSQDVHTVYDLTGRTIDLFNYELAQTAFYVRDSQRRAHEIVTRYAERKGYQINPEAKQRRITKVRQNDEK